MEKLTTILCSIAFAISGLCLAKTTATKSTTSATISAATLPVVDMSKVKMPVDFLLSQQTQEKDSIRAPGKPDTIYVEKPKLVKVHAPRKIKTKTVHVPILYIATRTDVKEDTVSHDSLSIYKVKKIGKIDLKKFNSSIDVNQHLSFMLYMFCAV